MPPLSPSQYWSFFVISNGFIAGKASLRVNGNCQTVDGGLLLDGTTSYLSSHLSRQNALSNPGGFLNGFSFGLKLKFPAAVLNSDDVRYILDTGEKSVSSPGLSLYLLNKKMILEVATRDTRWKVSFVLWWFLHSAGFGYSLLSAQQRETWLLSKYDHGNGQQPNTSEVSHKSIVLQENNFAVCFIVFFFCLVHYAIRLI